jgi:hypothetical protein
VKRQVAGARHARVTVRHRVRACASQEVQSAGQARASALRERAEDRATKAAMLVSEQAAALQVRPGGVLCGGGGGLLRRRALPWQMHAMHALGEKALGEEALGGKASGWCTTRACGGHSLRLVLLRAHLSHLGRLHMPAAGEAGRKGGGVQPGPRHRGGGTAGASEGGGGGKGGERGGVALGGSAGARAVVAGSQPWACCLD